MTDYQLLETSLRDQYKVVAFYKAEDFFNAPSSTLFKELYNLHKTEFYPNERIVFSCFNLTDDQIKQFLGKLQKCSKFIDIENFFILIVSNRDWILEYLNTIKQDHTTVFSYQHHNIDSGEVLVTTNAILNPPETICAYPWISLDIQTSGEFKPCCFFKENITNSQGINFDASKHSFEEVYNSDYMKDLRQQFRDGKRPDSCQRCWNEERDGFTSKRELVKHRFLPHSYDSNWEQDNVDNLKFVSVAFGNICNLRCRICGPANSSRIAEESISFIPKEKQKESVPYRLLSKGRWIKNDDALIWDQLLNQNLVYFDFAGGEPLLSNRHFNVLDTFVNTGRASEIELHYNTNATVFPEKYVHLWANFKNVDIAFSIDNIGARAELERNGCTWSDIEQNLKKFYALRSNVIKTSLHLALSIQNILYLPEICDWIDTQTFDSIHFSNVYWPSELSLASMTLDAKLLVINKLSGYHSSNPTISQFVNNIINTVKSIAVTDGQEFCKFMKILDQQRSEKFSESHPEIALAMGYSK